MIIIFGENVMENVNQIVASVVESQKSAIAQLKSERDRLVSERKRVETEAKNSLASIADALGEVEESLSAMGVKSRHRSRSKRVRRNPSKREHNDMNLVDAIVESLSSGPKSIKDILSSINYKSNSPNFRSIVQQTFTRHSVAFGRNGSVKANSEGPVSKTGDRGMFVRIGRGAYAVYSDGMTAQDVKSMSDNWVASHSG